MSINGNTGSLISDSSLSGYAPVSLLDSEYFGQQRQE